MNIRELQDPMCVFFSTPATLERVRMMKQAETQAEGWWKIETWLSPGRADPSVAHEERE